MVDEKKDVTTKAVEEKKDTPAQAEAPTEEKVEAKVEEVKKDEPKAEEKPADAKSSGEAKEEKGEEVEVPKEFKKIVEQIETMSVLELHELVKVLEKKFGVSAAAVAVAGPAGGDEGGAEEKTEFNVELM